MPQVQDRLKVLLVSFTLPQVGGLETMTRLIAREISRLGTVETRIITPTPGEWDPGFPQVTIHRQPSLGELHQHYAWADVVFFNHFYLRQALPLLWMPGKPCVLSISGYAPTQAVTDRRQRWIGRLLQALLNRANVVVACNTWCQKLLPVDSVVVPNPYDEENFGPATESIRSRDFLFAGRINEAKGCEELVAAYAGVCQRMAATKPTLMIAGEGPLEPMMRSRFDELGLASQVTFAGPLRGKAMPEALATHKVLLVPSRYQEPVGIVALEGLASGCIVVGSNGGGLAETINRFGFTFDNGSATGLAEAMHQAIALTDADRQEMLRGVELHLKRYQSRNVVRGYLDAVRSVLPEEARCRLAPA